METAQKEMVLEQDVTEVKEILELDVSLLGNVGGGHYRGVLE